MRVHECNAAAGPAQGWRSAVRLLLVAVVAGVMVFAPGVAGTASAMDGVPSSSSHSVVHVSVHVNQDRVHLDQRRGEGSRGKGCASCLFAHLGKVRRDLSAWWRAWWESWSPEQRFAGVTDAAKRIRAFLVQAFRSAVSRQESQYVVKLRQELAELDQRRAELQRQAELQRRAELDQGLEESWQRLKESWQRQAEPQRPVEPQRSLSAEEILSDPAELRRQGILVHENLPSQVRADELFPEFVGIKPNSVKNCNFNCTSFAVAFADRLNGETKQAVEIPTHTDSVLYNSHLGKRLNEMFASNLLEVLKKIRDDPNPRAHAIVGYEWKSMRTGREGGHSANIVKRNGIVALVDPQTEGLISTAGQKYTRVKYARTEIYVPYVPDINPDDGWVSGDGAFREMDSIINGPEKTRGLVKATLNRKPVMYQFFVAKGLVGVTVVDPTKGSKDITEYIRPKNGHKTWDTWKRLANPQVKLFPADLFSGKHW